MMVRHRRDPEFVQFFRGVFRPATPGVLTVLWRWRYEVALGVGIPAAVIVLLRTIGAAWTFVLLIGVVTAVLIWPRAVWSVVDRIWCLITAHRIRVGFAEALIMTNRGKIPTVLLVRPQASGERVYVWCRGGITLADLTSARARLAAACWADEVTVERDPRRANVAVINVIRRSGPRSRR